jgi:hypothetical protein
MPLSKVEPVLPDRIPFLLPENETYHFLQTALIRIRYSGAA